MVLLGPLGLRQDDPALVPGRPAHPDRGRSGSGDLRHRTARPGAGGLSPPDGGRRVPGLQPDRQPERPGQRRRPMRLAGVPTARAKARATELLERVGLGERGHHRPAPALRRAAAAGGHRPRPGARPAADPGRRAHGAPRPHPGRGHPPPDARPGQPGPHHRGLDPRRPGHPTGGPGDRAGAALLRRRPPARGGPPARTGRSCSARASGATSSTTWRTACSRCTGSWPTAASEVLAQVQPGNYVGELGPILNLPRSASVRARGEAFVIGYTVRAFRKDHPHHLADQAAT